MLLSVREFAKRAHVSRATVVYHIKKGNIKPITQDVPTVGIPEEELDTFKTRPKVCLPIK